MIEVIKFKNIHKYKRRLLALSDEIEKVPKNLFNMGIFRKDGQDTIGSCGTVGCVLGHAPRVMQRFKAEIPTELRYTYAGMYWGIDFEKVAKWFGVISVDDVWRYLFDSGWVSADNTSTGAAARIRWVVEHGGIPLTHQEERWRQCPLSYVVDPTSKEEI